MKVVAEDVDRVAAKQRERHDRLKVVPQFFQTNRFGAASVIPQLSDHLAVGANPLAAQTARQLRLLLAICAVYVVVVNSFQRLEQIHRLLAAIAAIGGAMALLALAWTFTPTGRTPQERSRVPTQVSGLTAISSPSRARRAVPPDARPSARTSSTV